jgi:H+-transporting ATPase
MMIARKLNIIGYIVVMLLVTRSFMLSITGTVMLLLLGDFGAMMLSSDNVRLSSKPDSFQVSRLFGVGGSLGLLMVIESVVFTIVALSVFGLAGSTDKIYTLGFAYLALAGMFTMVIIRERDHFWKSRPSNKVIMTVIAEALLVILVSLVGVLELAPLGYAPTLAVLGYTVLVTFVINDPVKVYLVRRFKAEPNSVGHGVSLTVSSDGH